MKYGSRKGNESTMQQNDSASIQDTELIEIIVKGDIHLFPLTDETEQFEKLLQQLLYRCHTLSQKQGIIEKKPGL
jgi:hypothetical protein